MIGYKLFRVRADGSLGTLFIGRKQRLPIGVWLESEAIPTKGYAFRPGWHVCSKQSAPHLSTKGRVWARVELDGWRNEHRRPESQGGVWYTSQRIKIVEVLA